MRSSHRPTFVGSQLRRIRDERGLTQAGLAQLLDISPSYLNQIERNRRALSVPILLRLAALGVDVRSLSDDDSARLMGELQSIVADPEISGDEQVTAHELDELVRTIPSVARTLVILHRRVRNAKESLDEVLGGGGSAPGRGSDYGATSRSGLPYEEVRDFFYDHRSFFPELDEAAESLVLSEGIEPFRRDVGLEQALLTRCRVRVVSTDDPHLRRRYDPSQKVLLLGKDLSPGRRAFQIAHQLALLEQGPLLDELTHVAGLSSAESRQLARVGLALYFAGAVVLPYRPFLKAAEATGYDIEALERLFGVGVETVCHRLSTLQRPGESGVPFFFVRVDRAGNISKAHSATGFHFSKIGGTCPLWNIFEAFATPGRISIQLAQMPDGGTYLWIARTVRHPSGRHGVPAKEFVVGLGCEARHAGRLVYSRGLDLADPSSAMPIGPGCRVCDREQCVQRAFPRVGRALDLAADVTTRAPYATI
jgi:predicted transcriptional regulator/transcriptional regulator with XRE-family HTH domain